MLRNTEDTEWLKENFEMESTMGEKYFQSQRLNFLTP